MAKFGEILSELRGDRKLKQSELAALMNVSVGTISNYETGRHTPDIDTIIWLADFFHVTTDYLLGRTAVNLPVSRLEEHFIQDETVGGIVQTMLNLHISKRELLYQILRSLQISDLVETQASALHEGDQKHAAYHNSGDRRRG